MVTHVWVHPDYLFSFELGGTPLVTTEDHPFWSITDEAWRAPVQLARGDELLSANGSPVRVTDTFKAEQGRLGAAYNLSVAGLHTFHVGEFAILVHNTDIDCRLGPNGWPVPTMDNCEQCADLIRQQIGGEIYRISPNMPGASRLGASVNDPEADWAEHFFVLRDGRAYDGFTGPGGMPYDQFRAQWEYHDALRFAPKGG